MAYRSSGLPSRFPVGTKLVIKGRPRGEGRVQVFKRYLEFPDGTFIRLPVHQLIGKSRTRGRQRSRARHHWPAV